MDPPAALALYQAVQPLIELGASGLKAADERVAKAAAEQGISKEEAWTAIRAEAKRRRDRNLERVLDPLGWKEAARALESEDGRNPSSAD